jgi:N-acetylglucosaminyl-diphospho-decaprenol L-rhamnosyltransferase
VSDRLLVVIVNYRTPAMVVDCLRSIAAHRDSMDGIRVLVVDNASGDDSVDRIGRSIAGEKWGSWARLIASPRNGGFAAGNNEAIRTELARPEADRAPYVLLLNPDTLVRPGALSALVEFMDAHPRAGVAGSRLEDGEGRIQSCRRRFPNPLGELEAAAQTGFVSTLLRRFSVRLPETGEPLPCDWVSGASMIVRTSLFTQVGLLDENFFLYYEEAEFCHRVQKSGGETWFVPASRIVHLEGASTGIRRVTKRRPRYWFESRRRFFSRVHGSRGWFLADCCWATGRLIWIVRKLTGLASPSPDPPRLEIDLLWGDLRAAMRAEERSG